MISQTGYESVLHSLVSFDAPCLRSQLINLSLKVLDTSKSSLLLEGNRSDLMYLSCTHNNEAITSVLSIIRLPGFFIPGPN